MPGYITAEGLVIPVGSDTYDYVNDQKRLSSSIRSVVPVTDSTGAATVQSGMSTDGRAVSSTNPLITWDQTQKKLITYDGSANSWGGYQHAEYTGSTAPTVNTLWGPGTLTLDSASSPNSAFVLGTSTDRVQLPAGVYIAYIRYSMSVNAAGTSWGAIVNDTNTNTFMSADIAAGNATIGVTRANLYLASTQNVRFTFISGAATGYTLTSRIAITKIQ